MTDTLLPVPFRGATLHLIDRDGEPYAAMRPIIEAMGLAWGSQRIKIKSRFATCVLEIDTQVVGDDQRRAMTCLPLRKLAGWLMTISVNKVRADLRDKIRAYQAECDDALWAYWTQGQATRQPAPKPTDPITKDVRSAINRRAQDLTRPQFERARRMLTRAARGYAEAHPGADVADYLDTANLGFWVEPPAAPALPAPAPKRYDFPAETARPNWRNRDDMINGYAWLHLIGSPLGDLLRALKADGHDVDGALIQFHALRGVLRSSQVTLTTLRGMIADALDAGMPWAPDLPPKLWAMKGW